MADVEALNAQSIEILGAEVEGLDERARTLALRTLLGEQARQRELGALHAHIEPDAPLLARLMDDMHARARVKTQCLHQACGQGLAHHQHRRHAAAEVVLRDKRLEHLTLG